MRQRRLLIVSADDLGLSDGVTEAIVSVWQAGTVTSTSAMINVEGAPERVASVHRRYPEMPIGLHLNITTGRPVLPPQQVPSLVDGRGRFWPVGRLMERLPSVRPEEVRAELQAQAELLLATGVSLDHLDYHEAVLAMYGPLFEVVKDLARQYRVPVRHPTPESLYGHVKWPTAGGAAGATVRKMLGFGLRHPVVAWRLMAHMSPAALKARGSALRAEGIAAPDWFIDGFYGRASVDDFVAMLRQLPPGVSEVVTHPGRVDDQLRALGGDYVQQRERELSVLLDPRVRTALDESGVELVDYSYVAGGGDSSPSLAEAPRGHYRPET